MAQLAIGPPGRPNRRPTPLPHIPHDPNPNPTPSPTRPLPQSLSPLLPDPDRIEGNAPPPTTSPPTPAPPGSTPRRRPSPDRSPDALRRLQHRRLPPRPELNRGARPRGAPSLGAAPHRRHRLASSPLPRATPATPSLTEHAVTIPTSRREPRLLLPSSVSRAHRGRVAPWPRAALRPAARTPAPSGLTRPHWLHVGSRTATSHRCRPARPRRPRPVPLPASPVTAPVVASASLRPPAAARASPRPPPRSAPRRQPPRRQPQRPHTSAHSG